MISVRTGSGRVLGARAMALAAALCLAACTTTPPPAAPINAALLQPAPLPEGYVWQRLGETDGQVAMPRDWFFASNATADGWTWLFTKEDTQAGNYLTGARLRIYLLNRLRLSESDGAAVAEQIVQQVRARAKQVVGVCPTVQQGQFMRQCVETLESGPGTGGETYTNRPNLGLSAVSNGGIL